MFDGLFFQDLGLAFLACLIGFVSTGPVFPASVKPRTFNMSEMPCPWQALLCGVDTLVTPWRQFFLKNFGLQLQNAVLPRHRHFIQLEELADDFVFALVHLIHCAKEMGLGLVQEDHPVG